MCNIDVFFMVKKGLFVAINSNDNLYSLKSRKFGHLNWDNLRIKMSFQFFFDVNVEMRRNERNLKRVVYWWLRDHVR